MLPNGALYNAIVATQSGIAVAALAIATAYARGRIMPEKLHLLQQWLKGSQVHRSPVLQNLRVELDRPPPLLLPPWPSGKTHSHGGQPAPKHGMERLRLVR